MTALVEGVLVGVIANAIVFAGAALFLSRRQFP
jgi:hypothetical protein